MIYQNIGKIRKEERDEKFFDAPTDNVVCSGFEYSTEGRRNAYIGDLDRAIVFY
jgi:hypothetical protein